MNIEAALKSPEIYDLRLVCGDAWMYWDETKGEWCVLSCRRYQKRNTVRYHGDDLDAALQALTRD